MLVESELREKVVAEEEGETVMKERVQAEEKKKDKMTLEDKAVMKEERTKQANEVTEEEKPSEEEDEAKMEAITIEAEAVRQHELVVEDSNGNTTLALVAADGDDILNTTYTIEPPELLVDDPDDALSSSLLHPSSESPCECISLCTVSVCTSFVSMCTFSVSVRTDV